MLKGDRISNRLKFKAIVSIHHRRWLKQEFIRFDLNDSNFEECLHKKGYIFSIAVSFQGRVEDFVDGEG